MGSEVFYRKWRPQTLSEVVGQQPVTQTLRHAVESGKIAHAYLFCGPRGTGKTSMARILAKAVNCPNRAGGEPCNACDMCRSVTEGRALDVIEIDAASNRGIDEIRSLREKANYAPSLARYKVYIIDEVHMLTEAACNALLKTLEEPPPHVIFVLATTEAHKVIATIISRCQRFNFHRLRQTEITDKLKLICKKEGIRIESGALELIARAATGSLRDAENILQQMIAYYGNQIELDQIQTELGTSREPRVRELARCVVSRDVAAGLRIVNSLNSDGIDLRQFNLGLVEYLRGLLLAKSRCEEALDVTSEDLAEMSSLATNAPMDYLLKAVKSFSSIDFRSDNYSALSLEMALLDCALSSQAGKEQPIMTTPPEVVDAPEMTKPPEGIGADAPVAVEPDRVGTEDDSEVLAAVVASEIPSKDIPQDIDYVRSRWRDFIKSLRGEGSSGNLDAFLRSACDPVALEDDTLVLGFYYSFHKEKIEDTKYRHLVEKKLKEVFGRSYRIRCILVDSKREVPSQVRTQNPVIKAALEMGARISEQESLS
ncbi:MAG: DNA polymerase III subunit gamma/tau [Dehalococcoidia bacterium]|nr:DNA polymerase III subunit gamma/tau [Dehalococcoidia bacterium]